MFGEWKINDCSLCTLKLIAFYHTVKFLPFVIKTEIHITYLRFYNALLTRKTR